MIASPQIIEEFEPYLGTLRQILSALGPQSPFQPSLKTLLKTLAENHGFIRPSLMVFDPESKTLNVSLTHGQVKNSQATYEPGQGVSGQVFTTGQPVIVPLMKEHPAFLNKAFGRTDEELSELAFICVPVITPVKDSEGSETIGTLSVDTPNAPYGALEAQCRFLEVVAGMIANQAAYLQEEMARQKHLVAQGLVGGGDAALAHQPSNIVATAKSMRLVLNQITQVGPSRATALLRGESGTGKELLAEAIHHASPRHEKSLVKLNCAALPSELVESELFGHQKGAFTGAVQAKKGLFELAHKGTLFLDEIGELPMNLQVKLLRFLQEMVFQRVGGRKDIEVNVRIVAATNVDIDKAIARGEFREDLFYRISVVNLHLPPLRERGDDVRLLAEHFLRNLSSDLGREITGFTPEAQAFLASYDWPGNIRELENKVRRAVVMADGARLTPSDLGFTGNGHRGEEPALLGATLREARASVEKKLVRSALARCKGNILKASEALGISRPTMYDLLKKHDIQNPGHR